jgi:hypothetical protein
VGGMKGRWWTVQSLCQIGGRKVTCSLSPPPSLFPPPPPSLLCPSFFFLLLFPAPLLLLPSPPFPLPSPPLPPLLLSPSPSLPPPPLILLSLYLSSLFCPSLPSLIIFPEICSVCMVSMGDDWVLNVSTLLRGWIPNVLLAKKMPNIWDDKFDGWLGFTHFKAKHD